MPKITLHERHFEFLRILVNDFRDHNEAIVGAAKIPPEVVSITEEVLTLLEYTRHFKRFTIEIEGRDDGEKV